jgi:amino acid transporter
MGTSPIRKGYGVDNQSGHGLEALDDDTRRLHELGYAQELKRGLGSFSNFAISFSIISILTGGITTYYLGMDAGGPRVITIGWFIVGFFTLLVGMGMAEITSAYPTAGGLYFFSAKLATKNKAAWSWATGWFNLVGQVAVTASIDYGLASYTAFLISLYHSSFNPTNVKTILFIYAVILVAHGLLNTFGVNLVSRLANVSAWWHLFGTAIIVGALLIVPSHHQSFSYLFKTYNLTGWTGPFAGFYAFSIGLLLAQYTLTGYDASAHMTEETKGAAIAGSKGIVRAIYVSIIAGFILNLAMTLSIPQGGDKAYGALAVNGSTAGAHLFMDAISGSGGKLLVIICAVAMFFCGLASVTANSRMIYAFARDGAVPGHKLWHSLHPKNRTPVNAVWFAVVGAFLLGVPSLYQVNGASVAFFAIVSIGTVGLYVAYAIPIFLRLRSKTFQPGPWNLGNWSNLVGTIACIWVLIITILFFAPAFYPWTTAVDINWSGPVFVALMAAVFIWYGVSARKWFTGPKLQGDEAHLEEIEEELAEGQMPDEA